MQQPYPLLLASQSPRRASLLREAGLAFEQRSPPFADPDQPPGHLKGEDAKRYAMSLSEQKALSMVDDITGSATVLAADTICVDHEGGLLGKPADRADAQTILRRLIAHPHRVITGVALLPIRDGQAGEMQCFADTAVVTFGKVSDEQLARYLATDGWRGKAGGYNLFDRQAEGWAVQVAGDPATVVGLPMCKLVPMLRGLV